MHRVLAVALAAAWCSTGCVELNKTYSCASNEQCVSGTVQGSCDLATSLCVFPDSTCPSGQRYGELAGRDSNQCTEEVPDAMPGENLRFVGVVAGLGHTCALEANGRVYCWGDNRRGQTGATTLDSAVEPGQVGISGVATTIVAGAEHTCALVAGNVFCWGDDSRGQLGVGGAATGLTATPQQITSLSSVTDIAAGDRHTCAITSDGHVYCWGADDSGQLGNGDPKEDQDVPSLVYDGTAGYSYTHLALGASHTCAAKRASNNYGLDCWGKNDVNQLGNVVAAEATAPVTSVMPVANSVDVRAGGNTTCFIRRGPLSCFGDNTSGQAGVTGTNPVVDPTAVTLDSLGARQISVGSQHSCAAQDPNRWLYCFGVGENGELGTGTTDTVANPVPTNIEIVIADSFADNPPAGTDRLRVVATGPDHTCAIVQTVPEKVWCWGSNSLGQLGLDVDGPVLTPTPVAVPRL